MPFCSECGKVVKLDWSSCPSCSHRLTSTEAKGNVQYSENKAGLGLKTTHKLHATLYPKNMYYRIGFEPYILVRLFLIAYGILLIIFMPVFMRNNWNVVFLIIFNFLASFCIVFAINKARATSPLEREKKIIEKKKEKRRRKNKP